MAFNNKKILKGKVIKTGEKTITVLVSTKRPHPTYKKRIKASKKYLVHDEKCVANEKDIVLIKESRPISARKHFILYKIVENAIINNNSLSKGGK